MTTMEISHVPHVTPKHKKSQRLPAPSKTACSYLLCSLDSRSTLDLVTELHHQSLFTWTAMRCHSGPIETISIYR